MGDTPEAQSELAKRYAFAESKFHQLCNELHIPFLDKLLYLRYFRNVRSDENLSKFLVVINALMTHKAQTLIVLQLVFQREQILEMFRSVIAMYNDGRVNDLEAKTKVLQLLYGHQQITLQVVEAIQDWRGLLTRPFPFHFRNLDYTFKIRSECRWLDAALKPLFPTSLAAFPLASNMPILHTFYVGETSNGGFSRDPSTGSLQFSITYPLQVTKRSGVPSNAVNRLQKRLKRAEVALLYESELQSELLRELQTLHARGAFLPLLNTAAVVPNCCSGVTIRIPEFVQRLGTALDAWDTKHVAQERELEDAANAAEGNPGHA
eukprot:TRINITY_DN21465_c0_g1_i1.p1 TRINITY_DN21465_c0_g1~~TRINITY_DN21465_c0_g1_i1.p1  ORF type:complete len:321 (-),score=61.66 TRINITY_DN21465_c0_g1_i1:1178-2140(-)